MLMMLNQKIFQIRMNSINLNLAQKSIFLLLILSFCSCQKKDVKLKYKSVHDFIKTSDLYNKCYYISPKLNTENCTSYNDGCDCCDGKIVFLTNGTFISDFYCIPTKSYNTGTFKIENRKLILNYTDKEALFGPENEDDYDGKNILRLETSKCGTTTLQILRCKKKYIFKGETDYFAEYDVSTFDSVIKEYKKAGVWELLEIND